MMHASCKAASVFTSVVHIAPPFRPRAVSLCRRIGPNAWLRPSAVVAAAAGTPTPSASPEDDRAFDKEVVASFNGEDDEEDEEEEEEAPQQQVKAAPGAQLRNYAFWALGLAVFFFLPFLQPTWLYSATPALSAKPAPTATVRVAPARPDMGAFMRNPGQAASQYADYMRSPPVDNTDAAAQLEYYSTTNIAISSFVVMAMAVTFSALLTAVIRVLEKVAAAVWSWRGGASGGSSAESGAAGK